MMYFISKKSFARVVGLFLGCLSVWIPAFNLQSISEYTLRYEVLYRGTDLGELEISIEKSNQGVIVSGETFPNALADLIGDGKVVEKITYQEVDGRLLLTRVKETKGEHNPKIKQLEVDHDQGKVITQEEQIYISKQDQIDAYTFPLLSILGLSDEYPSKEATLVSVDKIRRYENLPATYESIETQAGIFETKKLVKKRRDKDKTIVLWLTKKAPIMPVQIQVNKDGKQSVRISLKKVTL